MYVKAAAKRTWTLIEYYYYYYCRVRARDAHSAVMRHLITF
jgi:hypothetical protein